MIENGHFAILGAQTVIIYIIINSTPDIPPIKQISKISEISYHRVLKCFLSLEEYGYIQKKPVFNIKGYREIPIKDGEEKI